MTDSKTIGHIVRVEWDQETDQVRVIFDIDDAVFKSRILHGEEYQDILSISGKNIIVVASG
jgi:hypothetical protein